MSDQSKFSKVSAFGNSANFDLDVVLAGYRDPNSAGLHKVHTVGRVTLPNDALGVFESPRIKSVSHVHPLVRLQSKHEQQYLFIYIQVDLMAKLHYRYQINFLESHTEEDK